MAELSLFEASLFREAPEDEPAPELEATGLDPPDVGGDPPDLYPGISGGDDEAPPDIPDMNFDEPDQSTEDGEDATSAAPVEVSEKISMAMNYRLYQRFLTLSNTVANQLATIKSSNDIIHSVSPTSLGVIEPLGKLGENIRLYLANNFLDNNYSRNLFFYNKCLNLMKLLSDIFNRELHKGKI